MSNVAVIPLNEGGSDAFELKKIWEGSLSTTNTVDDITGGVISPNDYDVLLVHYEAEITAKKESGCIGMAVASKTGNVTYDMTYATGDSDGVPATTIKRANVLMLHSGGNWNVLRRQDGMILVSTTTPFRLSIAKGSGILTSATFHFVIYGIKL